jgi:hypothetical protein
MKKGNRRCQNCAMRAECALADLKFIILSVLRYLKNQNKNSGVP